MKATANYHRIKYLGMLSATRASAARRSAMLEFARLQQAWTWVEQRTKHYGWDIFTAWVKERDVPVLCRELRDQLLWISMYHGVVGYDPDLDLSSRLYGLCRDDAETLHSKGESYGDSWKQRGGVGAFMMLARKWDRIANIVGSACGHTMDNIIHHNPGDVLDDVDDLRCYLLLVEDEMMSRVLCPHPEWRPLYYDEKQCVVCGLLEGRDGGEEPGPGYVNQG